MGYIYKIVNNINNKIYIGKTVETVERRFYEHLNEAKTNRFFRPLYAAMNKYGLENFTVETIEEVQNALLDSRETYWITFYNSYIGSPLSNGYNATLGGDGTIKYDYELIALDYLKTQNKGMTAKNFNCSLQVVRNACNAFNISNFNRSAGVSVQRIDSDGNIKVYTSILAAAKDLAKINGKNPQNMRKRITYLLKKFPNQKAYGYYWKEIKNIE